LVTDSRALAWTDGKFLIGAVAGVGDCARNFCELWLYGYSKVRISAVNYWWIFVSLGAQMQRIFVAAIALATFSVAPALAADMAVKAPPVAPMPAWSWTGFYVGANVGGGWAHSNETSVGAPPAGGNLPFTIPLHGSGAVGGIQAGYNWQLNPSVLFGLEGDWDAAGIRSSNSFAPVLTAAGVPFVPTTTGTASRNVDWLASIRGRLGYTFNQTLLYVTGGAAFSRIGYAACLNCNLNGGPVSFPATFSSTKSGAVVGAGIEQAIAGNWSVRAEYLYYQFSGASAVALPTPANPPFTENDSWSRTTVQTVRVGIDYKFGGPTTH
jgi:outer membrane immunogenic protein